MVTVTFSNLLGSHQSVTFMPLVGLLSVQVYNYQNVTCRQFDDNFDRNAMELVDTVTKYLVAAANARNLLIIGRISKMTGARRPATLLKMPSVQMTFVVPLAWDTTPDCTSGLPVRFNEIV